MPAKPSTKITLEVHEGTCSDGTTRAATLHVEGPDGSFDWCGGEPAIRSLQDFLANLRLTDYRIAQAMGSPR